ncbi:high-affinity iron permease [Rhizophlyctis rosea]|uniref:High-affinity iron permease n=1 Tax=Rhizophlyctis rosea TaxID=64517 RepID=A0AAD5SJ08_9FUNG|nr:high-affinity iron permease [Rhizophlyctis rosea]
MGNYFSVPAFFILFRETTEAAIVVSILLSFAKQLFGDDEFVHKRLRRQIWLGTIFGLLLAIAIGAIFIGIWYRYATNVFEAHEFLWEGSFALIGCVLITVMAVAMLRASQPAHQERWRKKLMGQIRAAQAKVNKKAKSDPTHPTVIPVSNNDTSTSSSSDTVLPQTDSTTGLSAADQNTEDLSSARISFATRYTLLTIPFVTILREGLEAMLFLGGVSITESPSAIPIPAILGILIGALVGFLIYRGSSRFKLHLVFVLSTMILFLIAAGLWAKAIYSFETDYWFKHINGGGGDEGPAIGYNPLHSVWHLECCTKADGGWGIFNALLGWNNDGTIGTVVGYCAYWIVVSVALIVIKKVDRKREVEYSKTHDDIIVGESVGVVTPIREKSMVV